MHDVVHSCLNITDATLLFLEKLEQQMGIVADLTRADLLLYGRRSGNEAVVLVHAQPNSIARVYNKSREGRVIDIHKRPEVLHALMSGKHHKDQRSFISEGAPVVRKSYPVYYPPPLGTDWRSNKAQVVGSLSVVTNLIEYERHRLRIAVFRDVVHKLHAMLLRGRLIGAEILSPFGEHDGIMYMDNQGVIQYASGVAANLYRRVGYKETIIGRHISELETYDTDVFSQAKEKLICVEREDQESNRTWIRKALPIFEYPNEQFRLFKLLNLQPRPEQMVGILITIHDDTDTRRQNQEMQIKNAMIQEVHHRVKNNLQTIAGLVRMQSRRLKSVEAKTVLDETLNRILSVAVIHEFLSNEDTNIINIKDVSQRIIGQFQYGILSPDQNIKIRLVGESIRLPARQATACSLIINELIQNAFEHGVANKPQGLIQVNLQDRGDEVIIIISDNGDGIPKDFDIEQTNSLGMHIVKLLVEGDLRGTIQFSNGLGSPEVGGLSVKINFPKTLFEGEKGWKEHVL